MHLLHSITDVRPEHDGVGVTGSHGGSYAAWVAHRSGLRTAIFNDAGRGLDDAGVAGVMALGRAGMAAAAVTHVSAMIGDANETAGGTIGTANPLATVLGVEPGQSAREAAELLAKAERGEGTFPAVQEGRAEWHGVVLLDSASLVGPDDAGRIVVTGSHGGLIGGDATRAVKALVKLAVFNDAGFGKAGPGGVAAGVARIRVLEGRGIAAAAIAHDSAPIGEARPMLDGRLSFVNAQAQAMGLKVGAVLADALRALT